MNERREITRFGRRITCVVVIILLFGTLLPLFGNTASAGQIENFVEDTIITTTTINQANVSQDITADASTDNEPLTLATKIYGTMKYEDKTASGQNYIILPDGSIRTGLYDHTYLPLRHTTVKLFQYYWWSGGEICLKTTSTTKTGYFSFDFDPYPTNSDNQYFVRVYSESDYAKVKDSDVYTHDSEKITIPTYSSGQQYRIPFTDVDYPDHPAWNILDSVTEAAGNPTCKHNSYTLDNQYIPR